MRNAVFALILTITSPLLLFGQAQDSCADLNQAIKATYDFRPALLANDTERNQKIAAMDKVWDTVKAHPNELVPCLRQALVDPQANAWFRFDGSNLLVSLDPSEASKKLQIKSYVASNLEDVDLRVWVTTLATRGVEGLDVSEAGERWLSSSKALYFLPEHGAFEVNKFEGALFIFGSMDEGQAVPALLRIINQSNHPGREVALAILLNENTPESLRSVKQLDVSNLSPKAQNIVRNELAHPDVFEPRSKPKTSRKEFLDAFEALLKGNSDLFLELVSKVSDGERDVVATLTPEDLPLVRQVRRTIIAGGNQHSIEFYASFTKIIRTIMLKNTDQRPRT